MTIVMTHAAAPGARTPYFLPFLSERRVGCADMEEGVRCGLREAKLGLLPLFVQQSTISHSSAELYTATGLVADKSPLIVVDGKGRSGEAQFG